MKKMAGRKQRGRNWTEKETESLLDLRFNDEEILYKFNKAKGKLFLLYCRFKCLNFWFLV